MQTICMYVHLPIYRFQSNLYNICINPYNNRVNFTRHNHFDGIAITSLLATT